MNAATFNEFFLAFPMRGTSSAALDSELAASTASLDILFLWGRDCVNCDVAKAEMLLSGERFRWPDVRWLHANVYNDPDMATQFGLHLLRVSTGVQTGTHHRVARCRCLCPRH